MTNRSFLPPIPVPNRSRLGLVGPDPMAKISTRTHFPPLDQEVREILKNEFPYLCDCIYCSIAEFEFLSIFFSKSNRSVYPLSVFTLLTCSIPNQKSRRSDTNNMEKLGTKISRKKNDQSSKSTPVTSPPSSASGTSVVLTRIIA